MKGVYIEVSHTLLSRDKGLTDNLASASVNLAGQLEDGEITTSLGKQLLIVFSTPVFLELVRKEQNNPAALGHTRPPPSPAWSTVTADISLAPRTSHLAPRTSAIDRAQRDEGVAGQHEVRIDYAHRT